MRKAGDTLGLIVSLGREQSGRLQGETVVKAGAAEDRRERVERRGVPWGSGADEAWRAEAGSRTARRDAGRLLVALKIG